MKVRIASNENKNKFIWARVTIRPLSGNIISFCYCERIKRFRSIPCSSGTRHWYPPSIRFNPNRRQNSKCNKMMHNRDKKNEHRNSFHIRNNKFLRWLNCISHWIRSELAISGNVNWKYLCKSGRLLKSKMNGHRRQWQQKRRIFRYS